MTQPLTLRVDKKQNRPPRRSANRLEHEPRHRERLLDAYLDMLRSANHGEHGVAALPRAAQHRTVGDDVVTLGEKAPSHFGPLHGMPPSAAATPRPRARAA